MLESRLDVESYIKYILGKKTSIPHNNLMTIFMSTQSPVKGVCLVQDITGDQSKNLSFQTLRQRRLTISLLASINIA